MSCPNCQTENPDGAKFCFNCGSPLASQCSHCQTELPAQAKFCLNCGQPVTAVSPAPPAPAASPPINAPAMAGERRVVTIMFADISGFTAMSEKMDPEQVRNLMNRCFDQLVPIVEKYGGVVDKFIGDEIMALFGAPVAHEDDPARALHTGLEMMARLEAFNRAHDTDLGMHAGINTGLVVAGGIGSRGRRDYSVMGDAVNLAARLEGASERGEIFVGPDTYRYAAPLFEFEALPPLQLKGKADPVPVYKLIRAKAEPGRVRGLAGLASPMVGRDGELARLLPASQAIAAGNGRLVTLSGEPGLGKSRLLTEWQTAVANDNLELHWVTGQCLSYGQGLAYHLLLDLLRDLIGVGAAAAEEAATKNALLQLTTDLFGDAWLDIYPYLGHLLSLRLEEEAAQRVNQLDPQSIQTQYLTALRRLLQALAAKRPLCLILEDIHWADPSSTELVIKLLPLIHESPILFCFITRPEPDTPGWKLMETAATTYAELTTAISLQALPEAASNQLIRNLLEIEELPAQVRQVILQKAEGNPLFVEEVIRMLIDRELLVEENGRWLATQEIESVEIPDNLQGLLLARIDRLPENIKHTLRVASVIGRQFSVKVLEQVLQNV